MTATITLSEKHAAFVETSHYGADRPVIVVTEDGRRTPGQWFAETIAEGAPSKYADGLYIDFGAGWKLDANEAALLFGFAVGVVAASKLAPAKPVHTVRGKAIGPEGVRHLAMQPYECNSGIAHDEPGTGLVPFPEEADEMTTDQACGARYGTTHDMDCPACQGTSFTASPRSESYWAS